MRKKDDSLKFDLELLEDRLNQNEIIKVQNFSNLTKIKIIIHSITHEMGVMPLDLGNKCYLYEEDGEIELKTMHDFIDLNKFETKFGLMVTEHNGEWGGALYNITENGAEKVADGNFRYVFEYNNKVYAVSSLSHLTSNWSSLHEIRKFNDKFVKITIFRCCDLTISGSYCENNYFYFYSNSVNNNGLYRFNLDNNELELIHKDLSPPLVRVNSLLKKRKFYLYLWQII